MEIQSSPDALERVRTFTPDIPEDLGIAVPFVTVEDRLAHKLKALASPGELVLNDDNLLAGAEEKGLTSHIYVEARFNSELHEAKSQVHYGNGAAVVVGQNCLYREKENVISLFNKDLWTAILVLDKMAERGEAFYERQSRLRRRSQAFLGIGAVLGLSIGADALGIKVEQSPLAISSEIVLPLASVAHFIWKWSVHGYEFAARAQAKSFKKDATALSRRYPILEPGL